MDSSSCGRGCWTTGWREGWATSGGERGAAKPFTSKEQFFFLRGTKRLPIGQLLRCTVLSNLREPFSPATNKNT